MNDNIRYRQIKLGRIDSLRDDLRNLLVSPYPYGQEKLPSKLHESLVEGGIKAIDLLLEEVQHLEHQIEELLPWARLASKLVINIFPDHEIGYDNAREMQSRINNNEFDYGVRDG